MNGLLQLRAALRRSLARWLPRDAVLGGSLRSGNIQSARPDYDAAPAQGIPEVRFGDSTDATPPPLADPLELIDLDVLAGCIDALLIRPGATPRYSAASATAGSATNMPMMMPWSGSRVGKEQRVQGRPNRQRVASAGDRQKGE